MYIEDFRVPLRGGALASTLKTLVELGLGDEAPEGCMSHFLELQAGFEGRNRHKGVGAPPSGRAILTVQ